MTSGQARGLHGDAGRLNAHGYRFGCALEQPAAWSWCLRVMIVARIGDSSRALETSRHAAQKKSTPMKCKAAVVIQASAGLALVLVSLQQTHT